METSYAHAERLAADITVPVEKGRSSTDGRVKVGSQHVLVLDSEDSPRARFVASYLTDRIPDITGLVRVPRGVGEHQPGYHITESMRGFEMATEELRDAGYIVVLDDAAASALGPHTRSSDGMVNLKLPDVFAYRSQERIAPAPRHAPQDAFTKRFSVRDESEMHVHPGMRKSALRHAGPAYAERIDRFVREQPTLTETLDRSGLVERILTYRR